VNCESANEPGRASDVTSPGGQVGDLPKGLPVDSHSSRHSPAPQLLQTFQTERPSG
jgi:hypothetical protein